MNRKALREYAVKLFYEMDIHKSFDEEMKFRFMDNNNIGPEEDDYLNRISDLFIEHKEEIDKKIEKNTVSWAINRIAKIDLSILRMSFTEIIFMKDIPNKVTVNEAVELGKMYGNEKSYKFINGVLGNFLSENMDSVAGE